MIGVAACVLGLLAAGPVRLHSGDTIPADRVSGYSDQGVLLRPDFLAGGVPERRIVGWAEVAEIEGGWGDAAPFREVADTLRRAERRLARGDVPGASALLGPVAASYLPTRGPTSGAVASALAACRVMRGDRAGGADAWLAWRDGAQGPARDWIDAGTGLMPSLPPVWTEQDGRRFLAADDERPLGPESSEVARTLAGLYADAAAAAAGVSRGVDPPPARLRADPGVRLVWEVVRAQAEPDAGARGTARERLRQRHASDPDAWQAAWARLALGASMVREDDRIVADAGAAELIGVLIEHRDAGPGLAGLAAELAAGHFESTGRAEHAAAVRSMDRAARVPRPVVPGGAVRPDGSGGTNEETP